MKKAKKIDDAAWRRKARRALELADGVMSYVAGDAWEREVTANDRKKFDTLFEELMGKARNAA
jgi:hypothetical protein